MAEMKTLPVDAAVGFAEQDRAADGVGEAPSPGVFPGERHDAAAALAGGGEQYPAECIPIAWVAPTGTSFEQGPSLDAAAVRPDPQPLPPAEVAVAARGPEEAGEAMGEAVGAIVVSGSGTSNSTTTDSAEGDAEPGGMQPVEEESYYPSGVHLLLLRLVLCSPFVRLHSSGGPPQPPSPAPPPAPQRRTTLSDPRIALPQASAAAAVRRVWRAATSGFVA